MKKMLLALCAVAAAAPIASANPHPLPFSYPYETLPQGKVEVEQYMDYVPVRFARELADGTLDGVWGMRSVLTTEIEVGLTDRLEFGFYLGFQQSAQQPFLTFQGFKQRLHYRFAEAGELPVDIGVYVEIVEKFNELEFEQKLLLAKRVGPFNFMANLWVEQEWYYQTDDTRYIYNPTAGVAYQISPRFFTGVEYWCRGRFDDPLKDNRNPTDIAPTSTRHYLGPTFLWQSGIIFFALGVYARLDGIGKAAVVDDQFGKIWMRSIIGLELN